MGGGEYVELQTNHVIVAAVRRMLRSENQRQSSITYNTGVKQRRGRDFYMTAPMHYFVTEDEMRTIDRANAVFESERPQLAIVGHDIIGWALRINTSLCEVLKNGDHRRRRRQRPSLVWVERSHKCPLGRISRTFLELAVLARGKDKLWRTKYRTTRTHRKGDPYEERAIEGSRLFVTLGLCNDSSDFAPPFVVPRGFISGVVAGDSSSGEYVDRETLVELGLLDESYRPTGLLKAMVNVFERWWISEGMIAHPEEIGPMASYVPIDVIPYVVGQSGCEIPTADIALLYSQSVEGVERALQRTIDRHLVVDAELDTANRTLRPISQVGGPRRVSYRDLVKAYARSPAWEHYFNNYSDDYSLLRIRAPLVTATAAQIAAAESGLWVIEAPKGWGKTGTLLQIAQLLESKEAPLAQFRPGPSKLRLAARTVVLCDDLHRLSPKSLEGFLNLVERGYRAVATLSTEFARELKDRIRRLEYGHVWKGSHPVLLSPLSEADLKMMIERTTPDESARLGTGINDNLVRVAQELGGSPDIVAWLSFERTTMRSPIPYEFYDRFFVLLEIIPLLLEVADNTDAEWDEHETAALALSHTLGPFLDKEGLNRILLTVAETTGTSSRPTLFKRFLRRANQFRYLDSRLVILLEECARKERTHGATNPLRFPNLIRLLNVAWDKDPVDEALDSLRAVGVIKEDEEFDEARELCARLGRWLNEFRDDDSQDIDTEDSVPARCVMTPQWNPLCTGGASSNISTVPDLPSTLLEIALGGSTDFFRSPNLWISMSGVVLHRSMHRMLVERVVHFATGRFPVPTGRDVGMGAPPFSWI